MNTTTTTTRLMATEATKTRTGRRASTSPPRASRAGGPTGSAPASARPPRPARGPRTRRREAARRLRPRRLRPGDSGQGYEDRAAGYDDDGYNGYGPGGYGTDEYSTGAYDLPEGADEERGERGGRRRKERGERGSRLRLGRRDRGEEIWPDDGVSDEDYWASVASDRPLTGGNPPPEADLPTAADGRPMGRPGGRGNNDDVRAAAGSRSGADPRAVGDQRYGDDQRGATGRLGPPPGLVGDYQPGGGASAGGGRQQRADGRLRPVRRRAPGTGPMAARPGTGPISAWSSQAGYAQSGTGPRPSFQPGPAATAGGRAGRGRLGRADGADRASQRSRLPGASGEQPRSGTRQAGTAAATSDPFGAAGGPAAPGRGRIDAAGQTTAGSTARIGELRTVANRAVTSTANRAGPPAAGRVRPAAALRDRTGGFPAPTGPATARRRRPPHQHGLLARRPRATRTGVPTGWPRAVRRPRRS